MIKSWWPVWATLIAVSVFACIKDADSNNITTDNYQQSVSFNPEDFQPNDMMGREGVRLPFDFPKSNVIIDLFTAGRPEWALNIKKVDSTTYQRFSTAGANYQGVTFHQYVSTRHFKDGTVFVKKVYAPANGSFYKVMPIQSYNQLDSTNRYNFIQIVSTPRSEPYFDHRCGKSKRRYFYTIISTDTLGTATIDADRCFTNVFSYKLIN